MSDVDSLRDRVSVDRLVVPDEADLPYVMVFLGNEDVEKTGLDARSAVEHVLQVNFDVFAIGSDVRIASEEAEHILGDIESALADSPTLLGLVESIAPRSLTVDNEDEGKNHIVRVRALYEIVYLTRYGSPDVVL